MKTGGRCAPAEAEEALVCASPVAEAGPSRKAWQGISSITFLHLDLTQVSEESYMLKITHSLGGLVAPAPVLAQQGFLVVLEKTLKMSHFRLPNLKGEQSLLCIMVAQHRPYKPQ